MADEQDFISSIDSMVAEEHELRSRANEGEGLSEEDEARLARLEVALDQCWDLLRQRRALQDAGRDPGQATIRDPNTVEGYRQ
jgi:hypothetical protein